jgi:FkbM family methyltransferase
MLSYFLGNLSDEINGVIHVGAHSGQEVTEYDKYVNEIILFEPQKKVFKELVGNLKNNKNIHCYNLGLGSKNETRKLFISEGNEGLSSSVLAPELHLEVQNEIYFNNYEEIQIKRFDTLNIKTLNFLTLDVQGFELEVLKGFGQELNDIKFIFTEINTKFLYKNNALVGEIDSYLKNYDFERVYTNIDCFNYFGDAFYIKKSCDSYNRNPFRQILNIINISNFTLKIKKLLYPKRLFKNLYKKFF